MGDHTTHPFHNIVAEMVCSWCFIGVYLDLLHIMIIVLYHIIYSLLAVVLQPLQPMLIV
jgi:hypothetical protein